MISRTVKIQLLVFALISVLGVAYTGFTYVGIRAVGPVHFAPGPYTVRAQFRNAGGIYTNAPVTDRGVLVGTVGRLTLIPNGVSAELRLNHGTHIPADATALVANLSAVGEQYVDLTPHSDGGPYLHTGSVIPMSRTSVPVDDATLLVNLDRLVNSVNRADLTTVIHELGVASDGQGVDLQRLIDRGNALLRSAQDALPQTIGLINDSRTVLDTQRATSGYLQAFSRSLNLFSQQLVSSDSDIRSLFSNGIASAQELQTLLLNNQAALPTLLGNLVTLGRIGADRIAGQEQTLLLYPLIVANGFLTTVPDPTDVTGKRRLANFGLVYQDQTPACKAGYAANALRRPDRFSSRAQELAADNSPANLNTLCTPPDQAGQSSGQSDARGAALAPRPAGDTTGQRGGAVGTTSSPGTYNPAPVTVTSYNPASNTFTGSDGRSYSVGHAGQESAQFGSSSLPWLLLAGAT